MGDNKKCCAVIRVGEDAMTRFAVIHGVQFDALLLSGELAAALSKNKGNVKKAASNEIFVDLLRSETVTGLEIESLSVDDIAAVRPYLKGIKHFSMTACRGVEDISFIEDMTELESLELLANSAVKRLPNFTRLPSLTKLSVVGDYKSLDAAGLADSGIKRIDFSFGSETAESVESVTPFGFDIFTKMPRLHTYATNWHRSADSRADLLALANAPRLMRLIMPNDSFTFAQFAWLRAQRPLMLGLECVREMNYRDEETPWSVLGSEYSGRYFNTDDAMEIRERFEELVEKYRGVAYPPSDSERGI
jgi:hypothetical protein